VGKSSKSRSEVIARLKARVVQVSRHVSVAPPPSREGSISADGDDPTDDADAGDAGDAEALDGGCADQFETQAYNANPVLDEWGAPGKFHT
jgi:hypothetical protein